ncbi:SDR family oxidoreductase [Nodosilinea sp. LEGE 07298]|uniref:SDR family oxidoreductase n=1 Tax=Nodosilinea sp. LEGE 07298 TaxID=2777970 RepID=UPI0018828353|nr:SDR family oxidoreductase [Nodosilinea sp. LEGE 07298]MBE9108160.1 SDR family oxidoreductase [Nodosilinea sp. LEGE 07298]
MIFVTGATGRVGGKLVESLLRSGKRVKVLVRNPQKATIYQALGVSVFLGDLNQSDRLEEALWGCDRLFSIPPNTMNQAEQEIQLYQAAKRAEIRHVVKLSTVKSDPESPCQFFKQHAIAEQYLKQSGIKFTILQTNSFMQNFLWFAHEMKTKGTLALPMRDAKTVPIDIRDVVRVGSAILTEEGHEGKTYNLTGSELLSLQEIAEKLSIVANQKITYIDASPLDFKQTLIRLGVPEWFAEAVTTSWQIASKGRPTLTDTVTKVGREQPITFNEFAWDYKAIFT